MYRILTIAVMGLALAGCKSQSSCPTACGTAGSDILGMDNGSTLSMSNAGDYLGFGDPTVRHAVNDLRHGKLSATRINAARVLGSLGCKAGSNYAIEALEDGTKDKCMEVRTASAEALRAIGTERALRHLQEEVDKGRVAYPCSNGKAPMAESCTPEEKPCPAPKTCEPCPKTSCPAPCPKPCPTACRTCPSPCPSASPCSSGYCPHNMSKDSCSTCRGK